MEFAVVDEAAGFIDDQKGEDDPVPGLQLEFCMVEECADILSV